MGDTSDLRTWFREDVIHALQAIEAASSGGITDDEFRAGWTMALVSVGLSFAINPNVYLTHRDIELMRRKLAELPGG